MTLKLNTSYTCSEFVQRMVRPKTLPATDFTTWTRTDFPRQSVVVYEHAFVITMRCRVQFRRLSSSVFSGGVHEHHSRQGRSWIHSAVCRVHKRLASLYWGFSSRSLLVSMHISAAAAVVVALTTSFRVTWCIDAKNVFIYFLRFFYSRQVFTF